MKKVKIKRKKKKPETKKPLLKKIKPRLGRWCEYYEGRLPFPIECAYNKETPFWVLYEKGEKTISKNTPNCPKCNRSIEYEDWKLGKWKKVEQEIKKGADLSDQPSPILKKI